MIPVINSFLFLKVYESSHRSSYLTSQIFCGLKPQMRLISMSILEYCHDN